MSDLKQVSENLLEMYSAKELSDLLVESFRNEGELGSEVDELQARVAMLEAENAKLWGWVNYCEQSLGKSAYKAGKR